MNRKLLLYVFIGAMLGSLISSLFQFSYPYTDAATITKGYTFATNEQVTAAKLHALVDSATLSSIQSADIAAGAIGNTALGANAVTTDKILDGTILGADLASRTLTSGFIATNAITEIELNSNLFFRAGIMSFSNVVIATSSISNSAVQGVQISAGAGDSGKIVKLNSSGKVDSTMLTVGSSTNLVMPSDVAFNGAYKTLVTFTNTLATSGKAAVFAQALARQDGASSTAVWALKLYAFNANDATSTNFLSFIHATSAGAASESMPFHLQGIDILNGQNRVYILQAKDSNTAGDFWTSGLALNSDATSLATNATQIIVINTP